jgi:predicted nucleotidyltransferase
MILNREQIIEAIRAAAEPLADVNAMWLGGSDAFGRVDEHSDIDAVIDVADGTHEQVFELVEQALGSLSPITRRYRLPEPTWHGHHQCFYELRDAGEFNQVDLVLMERSQGPRFDEREQHGEPVVLFDKLGAIKAVPMDRVRLREKLTARLEELRISFPMFANFAMKEHHRNDALAALGFYNAQTLRPLVELLRIKYDPCRSTFGVRYTHNDLPPEVVAKLEDLYFVRDMDDLLTKHTRAVEWFQQEVDQLDIAELEL